MDRKLKKKIIFGAIALLIAFFVFYQLKLKPIPVNTASSKEESISAEVMGTGTFEARFQATVSAKIQGRITELFVDQNDSVKEGQLLAQLDDLELKQEVSVASATLEAAKATVERLKAEETRAHAVLEQAKRDFERYSSLQTSKSVSQETLEKNREKLEIADAEIAKTVAATNEAKKQVITAEEKLRFEEAKLADTKIKCPFTGIITRRDREIGDIVIPGASIFQLISTREMWVSSWVDESAIADVKVNDEARIVFRAEPDKQYPAKVARLSREVDRETREFKVDVRAESLPQSWAVGQRAEVYIQTAKKDGVITIPTKALAWDKGKPGVMLADGSHAKWQPIKIGLKGIDKVEVLQGLKKDDAVILNTNKMQIPDGQRIKIQ